ncbi:MAG TPA: IPT/TIG domain-containing protein [Edaphobacter sp.]|nr:IPT/TIG domain-containing protein [Edaphobacter sp.]
MTLTVQSTQPSALRFVIADQRGDGRPDFAYKARVLYADSVTPANVPATGGNVVIHGMGFRNGDIVTVNNVQAVVSSSDASSIAVTIPSSHDLGFTSAATASIAVTDPATGGSTVMTGALNYAAPQPSLNLISSPSGTVFAGDTAPTAFAVRVLAIDGTTPMANQTVTFTADQAVKFSACGLVSCTVRTDTSGVASTFVVAVNAGTVQLSATSQYGTVNATFSALERIRTITAVVPMLYVAAGAHVTWMPQIMLSDNSASVASIPIVWQPNAGAITFAPPQSQTDAQGAAQAQASIGPLASGAQSSASACAWNSICTTFTTIGVGPDNWHLEIVSGAGQSVSYDDSLLPIVLRVVDNADHPLAGAAVEIHQTIDAWQMPCPERGRCPIPPNNGPHITSAISDVDGSVTVIPEQLPGAAEITNIVAATGSQGFVSLSLLKRP